MQKLCIYCNQVKNESDFSKEHIIPQSLIKNHLLKLNITHNVCKKCNNSLGRYVDAKFLKSFFYTDYNALGAYVYLDPKKTKVGPLIYWGILGDMIIQDDMTCELWGSPCGGRILHIHKKITGEFEGYAGGDPIVSRKEPGIAIFIHANTDHEKIFLGLRTFAEKFKDSDRYLANIKFKDTRDYKTFGNISDDHIDNIIKQFFIVCPFDKNGQLANLSNVIFKNTDNRLLAKLGIGLAFNALGYTYLNSKSYHELQNVLWNKLSDNNDFMIANFSNGNKLNLYEDFSWKGGIVITFRKHDGKILFFLNIYEYLSFIEIYNELADGPTSSFDSLTNKVFIVIPIINECVEVSFYDFLLFKKENCGNPILTELAHKRTFYKPY